MRPDRLVAPPAAVSPLTEAPTFSVVIPVFEGAETIAEAVESILDQEPPPAQLVVVDDGSRDRLRETLARFGDRIELVSGSHRGVAAARNAGWRRCGGDFVVFVDSDDLLLPGKMAALSYLARERPDLDLLATDMYFERNGQRTGRFGEANPFPTERQRETILERCFVVQPAFRVTALADIGGFDESLATGEDWDCLLRLILAGSTAGLYDQPLAVYRIHSGSLTDRRPDTFKDRVRILEKASRDRHLRPEERGALAHSLAVQRRRSAIAAAQAAVAGEGAHPRRLCLRVAATPGAGLRLRAWGLAAALLPARARPWLGRRSRRSSQLSRHLPGEPAE